MNLKGKRSFTQDEFNRIRDLVRELRSSDRKEQKTIRGKLRKMGFYISDFHLDPHGFTEGDLLELVQTKQIIIVE